MKKLVLFGFILIGLVMVYMMTSSQSPDDKAKTLIGESIEKALVHPKSYKPLETIVDSAFAPFDDPAFYEKTLEICKMNMNELDDSQAAEVQRNIQELSDMMGTEYRFIGFKVVHCYSAQDAKGEPFVGEKVFIIDKDVNTIIAEYDTDSLDYIMVQTMYHLWREESINRVLTVSENPNNG